MYTEIYAFLYGSCILGCSLYQIIVEGYHVMYLIKIKKRNSSRKMLVYEASYIIEIGLR